MMKLGLAYFSGYDQVKVDLQKQMGLEYVISGPAQLDPAYAPQSFESLSLLKKAYADQGLKLSIIEGPTGGATVTGFVSDDMKGVEDTWAGKVSHETLWRTLEAFLKEIVPLCEELGVNLSLIHI